VDIDVSCDALDLADEVLTNNGEAVARFHVFQCRFDLQPNVAVAFGLGGFGERYVVVEREDDKRLCFGFLCLGRFCRHNF